LCIAGAPSLNFVSGGGVARHPPKATTIMLVARTENGAAHFERVG
jgi:hypothetical protein